MITSIAKFTYLKEKYESESDKKKSKNIHKNAESFSSKFNDDIVKIVSINEEVISGTEKQLSYYLYSDIDTFIRYYDSSNNRGNDFIINTIEQLKEIISNESVKLSELESIDIGFDVEEQQSIIGTIYDEAEEYAQTLNSDYKEYSLTDVDNSLYISNDGTKHDLRDYININGYEIDFITINEYYYIDMFDIKAILK